MVNDQCLKLPTLRCFSSFVSLVQDNTLIKTVIFCELWTLTFCSVVYNLLFYVAYDGVITETRSTVILFRVLN